MRRAQIEILRNVWHGVLVVCSIAFLAACGRTATLPASPESLGLDVPHFTIPEPTRWQLSNGLEVYYYYNPELPVMRAKLYVQGGEAFDTSGIAGLGSATGAQIREGGSQEYRPDELDEYLDTIAASIDSSVSDEYATVSLFSLSEDFSEVFPLFSSIVRQPRFAEERLSLWKVLSLESIRRRADRPSTIAGMVFAELVYGRGSKFAEYTTAESIAAITPEKMREFHQRFFQPQRSKLAISGSLKEGQVRAAIQEAFGDWKVDTPAQPLIEPKLGAQAQAGIYLVRKDLDQASIHIGHPGPPRHTDDRYAITVFSEIFGSGGFTSVLFQEIRTRRGLAYSVYGGVFPDFVAGTFQVGVKTKRQQATNAISEVLSLAKGVRKEAPETRLFDEAKSSVERRFVFKFAKPEAIVDRAVLLDTLGFPKDYDAKYLERIDSVTSDEVRDAAERWIDLDAAIVLIVGAVSVEELQAAFPGMPIFEVEFDTAPGAVSRVSSIEAGEE